MSKFSAWVAHTDDNLIDVLYAVHEDTEKKEIAYLAKLIRRGLTVRGIRPEAMDRIGKCWGEHVSEGVLRSVALPMSYDIEENTAKEIATQLVTDRRSDT